MGLLNFFKADKPQAKTEEISRGIGVGRPIYTNFESTRPSVVEQKGNKWVMFSVDGTSDNAYPYLLRDFYESCPLHAAITTAKAKMAAGNAIKFNGQEFSDIETADAARYLPSFVEKINRNQDLYTLLDQVSLDLQIYGAMAFECVWSLDYSRVVEIVRVCPADVRSSECDTKYYIAEWNARRKIDPIELPAFNPAKAKDMKQPSQLLYVKKSSNLKHYGLPEYVSALESIALERSIIEFHKSSLNNQFAPSLVLMFPERPRTDEEADEFFKELKHTYSGTKNAGKPLVLFGENKTLPSVVSVESARLDERLINLKDSVTESIIYGHRVSSPALLGISIPGKLGMSQELPTAYKIFDKTVVGPDRRLLERTFTVLAEHWNVPFKVTIEPFNPTA